MINLADIDTGTPGALPAHTALTDAIRDALPPGHSEQEFQQAFAEHVSGKIEDYKQASWLVRFWFGQTSALRALADHDPVLFLDLVNTFGAKLDELT